MNKISQTSLIFSIFSLLIAGFLHPITSLTQDLGRHLLMGKIILKTYSVPQTNLFSYTYPDFPFINTHWLSEVIFYVMHQMLGFNGLLLISTAIVVFSFGLVFFSAIKKNSIFAATIASILYLRVLFERTDIRPELFSFLFLSIFIVILYKYREQHTRWIFLLPFLELLWVNMHIYFIVGIGVIGLFLFEQVSIFLFKKVKSANFLHVANSGKTHQSNKTNTWSSYINDLRSNATKKISWTNEQKIVVLFFILLTSCFTTLLNPNGLSGALYPFNVFQNYGYTIEENQTLLFLWNYFGGKTTIFYFFISATLLFITFLLTIKKTRPIDWLLAVFFAYLAANAERNLPLFVFGTFIPFTHNLSTLFSIFKAWPCTAVRPGLVKNVVALFFITLILWQIYTVVQLRPIGIDVAKGAERGADFFLENNLKGPIFNNFDIGSYLDYRLYPKEKVFIDGRPEAYPVKFFSEVYIPMQTDQKLFEEHDKKYHFNTIFFSHTDMTPWAQTFLKWIIEDKEWQLVYLDDYVIILVKNGKEKTSRESLLINNLDQTNKTSLLRLANFFRIVGWPEHEEKMYQQLLLIDPNNCIALYNLSIMLSQRNDPTSSIYTQRLQQKCN